MRTSRILRPVAVGMLALLVLLPACESEDEQSLTGLINAERAKSGLPALEVNVEAGEIAREWSASMAASNSLQHNSSLGTSITARIGDGWTTYGENVAYHASPQEVFNSWMASDGHRANILNPAFNRIGLGVIESNGMFWATAVFIGY